MYHIWRISIHASCWKKESCWLVRSTSSIDFHASYLHISQNCIHLIQPVDRNSSNKCTDNAIRCDRHAFPSRDTRYNNNSHSQVQRVVSWRSLGAGMRVSMQLRGFEERVWSRNGSMHRQDSRGEHEPSSNQGRGKQRERELDGEFPTGLDGDIAVCGYHDGR